MAKTYDTPLFYDESRKTHAPIPSGQYVDPELIPVSSTKDNVLEVTDDGLYVPPTEVSEVDVTVVSGDGGNIISKGSDGGALLTNTAVNALTEVYLLQNPVKVVSDNSNNLLRVGTDKGAQLTANDVLSNGDTNLLTVHPTDMKVFLSPDTVMKNLDVASDVAGNLLLTDENGRIYLLAENLLSENPGLLSVGDDGKLVCIAGLVYDSSTGKLALVDKDGNTLSEVEIAVAVSILKDVRLEKDGDEIDMVFVFELSDGSEKELKVDMTELVDVYKAGDGLTLDNGTFSVAVGGNSCLTFNANGKLTIDVEALAAKLASSGATVDMVSDVEGNALKVDDDGKLYVDVSGTEYTGVSPVKVEDNEISLNVSSEEGNKLEVKDDGLYASGVEDASELMSQDEGNGLSLGTDELLYFPLDFGELE